MKITLKPLGNIPEEVMNELKRRTSDVFQCPTEAVPGLVDLSIAYDSKRGQYNSSILLASLARPAPDERVVGIVDVDLYVPGLRFVFGEAQVASGRAIVSLYRLRPERYGQAPDQGLFLERAMKEIIHELGHTFGLGHCSNRRCVMHFSNSLDDTDFKQGAFCHQCRPKLIL